MSIAADCGTPGREHYRSAHQSESESPDHSCRDERNLSSPAWMIIPAIQRASPSPNPPAMPAVQRAGAISRHHHDGRRLHSRALHRVCPGLTFSRGGPGRLWTRPPPAADRPVGSFGPPAAGQLRISGRAGARARRPEAGESPPSRPRAATVTTCTPASLTLEGACQC